VYHLAAALALEVGKNRMEALGEAQETVDFFRCYADDFERLGGYERALPNDPLPVVSRNRSVMRPDGAWAVIVPFNYPLALGGGPAAAALVTGNTVVRKSSAETPWAGRLLADCLRDAAPAACRPGCPLTSRPAAPTSGARARVPRGRPGSPSSARPPSGASCSSAWRAARGRVPASPRWAARTRASSRRAPISTPR